MRTRSRLSAAETPMNPITKAGYQMPSSAPLPPPSSATVKDNEYERCREERIRENMEIMQKLGLANLVCKLKEDQQQICTPRRRSPKTSISTPTLRDSTPRRSSRLQSVSPVCYDELRVHNTEKRSRTTNGSSRSITEVVSKDEVYTEEHNKLLGSSESIWTLFVDGCGSDGRRIYDSINGKTCHQCRQKTLGHRTHCSRCEMVTGQFCGDCLYMRYGENVLEAKQNPDWICPVCRGICNCSICRVKKGWAPTGPLYRSVIHLGYKSVAHYLIQTRRGQSLSEKPGSGDPVSARKSLPFVDDKDNVLMLEYAILESADTKRLNDVNELPDPADSTTSVALQCQEKESNEKEILVTIITNLDESSSLPTTAEEPFKYDDALMSESAAFVISAGSKKIQSDDENEICNPDKESTVKEDNKNTVGSSTEDLDSDAISVKKLLPSKDIKDIFLTNNLLVLENTEVVSGSDSDNLHNGVKNSSNFVLQYRELPKINCNVNTIETVAELQPGNAIENQHHDFDELSESLTRSSTVDLQCQGKLEDMNGGVTVKTVAQVEVPSDDNENLHNSRDGLPESLKSSSNVVLQCQGELLTTVETVAISGHVSTSLRKRAREEDNPTTEENFQNPFCELSNDSNMSPSYKENNVHGPEKQMQNSVQKRPRKLKDRRPSDFTPSPDSIAGRLRKRQSKD